ncbi:MAG: hypothetical protein KatS3mg064_0804 [Tepidiforma sp.]|nr:CAP domain-containing protein [Tepidiforma sp.]GIW17647.1 MAG: hypothetical protein KatS3mg064_0804 [Tepidiforma sp.]
MRRLSVLPVLLGGAAVCSALALAALRLEAPAGAAHPAPQMSAAEAPLSAPDSLPVTEVTPAAEPTPFPTAVAEARATSPAEPAAPSPAPPTPAAPPAAASPEPVAALPAAVSQPVEVVPVEDKAVALLAAMNAARAAGGLEPLTWSPALAEVALARARDLIANGYFDHYGPDGRSAFSELAVRGIRYGLAGENLARNNYAEARTVEAAFQGLMGSAGHRANILEPRFANVGVAAVRSGRTWLYVTVFTD